MSETRSIARQFLSSSLTSRNRYYRYQIRPDTNYYPLRPSVEHLERNGVAFNQIEHMMMEDQNEVVAMLFIDTSNIMSAVEMIYDRNTSTVSEGRTLMNPFYQDLDTNLRNSIIPALPTPNRSANRITQVFGYLIPACLSLGGVKRYRKEEHNVKFYNAESMINTFLNLR